MKIQAFISNHLKTRMEKHPALVVYDPDGIYRDIVMALADDDCTVIDGGVSTILGREDALDAWRRIGRDESGKHRMAVYLPVQKPLTEESRRRDPYWIFVLESGPFPDSDGETFQALCRRAAPDLAASVDELFAEGIPDFETVDNLIGGGGNWPKLKTLLKAESAAEILTALMSPSESRLQVLKADKTWLSELKNFLDASLNMKLLTQSKQAGTILDEIRRYVLFSEFVLDLPEDLPESLKNVSHAPESGRDLIYQVCRTLRTTETHQHAYMDMAAKVAADLNLESQMKGVSNFGVRDTFSFEERAFLKIYGDAALEGRYGDAEEIMKARRESIWVKHTSERMQLWTLADYACKLLTACEDIKALIPGKESSLAELTDFYVRRFREIDGLHRQFEQAVTDAAEPLESLEKLVDAARNAYRDRASRVQTKFMDAVSAEGWPAAGMIRHTQVFDKFAAPWLKERKKVAFFMVDALRYELAVELENQLSGGYGTTIDAVCGQLPAITPVGMAALLPGSADGLRLIYEKEALTPYIKDRKIMSPKDRFEYVRSIYGDMCAMRDLDDLISKSRVQTPKTVRLLLVKTTDIDKFGELTPFEARWIMPRLIRKLITGIKRVRDAGFDQAVIASDHGFVLMNEQLAGDTVETPPGEWILKKRRCLLGKGSSGPGVLVLDKAAAGIDGDFEHLAVPRNFGTFIKGKPYFHEGLSLQECILPVLCVELGESGEISRKPEISIALTYKKGATDQITTRRPMIEIAFFPTMFEETLEFNLTAFAGKEIVGEPAACPHVNPATSLVSMKSGQVIKVPLKMDEEFHGEFEVRVVDPETQLNYASLSLKTNYLD